MKKIAIILMFFICLYSNELNHTHKTNCLKIRQSTIKNISYAYEVTYYLVFTSVFCITLTKNYRQNIYFSVIACNKKYLKEFMIEEKKKAKLIFLSYREF